MPQSFDGVAVIVPIVTDHTLYAPASTTMLNILRRFVLPALQDNPASQQAHHYALELQFMLAQIQDVEQQANKKTGNR